jgi:rsbT co-antagonist protein RsbR
MDITYFRQIVVDNSDEIIQKWLKEVSTLKKEEDDSFHTVDNEFIESRNREFVNVIFTSIKDPSSTKAVEEFAEKIIKLGWPLSYITDGLEKFRSVTTEFILNNSEQLESNSNAIHQIIQSVDSWISPIIRLLVDEYSGNWESTLSLQRMALNELSAPLIPVIDRITIMPLIGTIDTERAQLIMENLLDGTITHNAEVVLIDITGVPVVDTMVAHHLIQAAEAVRLTGATCILVGIRPEIAQTIVNLGIDLSKFVTKSSLKKGFEAALEMTNRKIVHFRKEEDNVKKMIAELQEE